jgi:hypothetical protein
MLGNVMNDELKSMWKEQPRHVGNIIPAFYCETHEFSERI